MGIATAVALSMFNGNDQAKAIGVPLYYGFAEVVILLVFCLYSWKKGWTFAPARATEVLCRSSELENGASGALFTDPATELYALVYILSHVRGLNEEQDFIAPHQHSKLKSSTYHPVHLLLVLGLPGTWSHWS